MKIFLNSDLIISPHGSNLSNIIFCKKGTKVIEICPKFDKSYEENLSNRYDQLSLISNLEYIKITSDSVDVSSHTKIAEKYINKNVLNDSNYYKNLIVKISEIDRLINNL